MLNMPGLVFRNFTICNVRMIRLACVYAQSIENMCNSENDKVDRVW